MYLNPSNITFKQAASPADPQSRYPGFAPGTTILKAGTVMKPGAASDHRFDLDRATIRSTGTIDHQSSVAYDATTGEATFTFAFDREVEINGFPQARLFIEAEDGGDADVFVKLVKLSRDGEPLGRVLLPKATPENAAAWDDIVKVAEGSLRTLYRYDGPWGRMRASRRDDADPREAPRYVAERRLQPGELVHLPITMTPVAMLVHRGERLRLTVSGVNLTPYGAPGAAPPKLRNKGRHIIHLAGPQASSLILPLA